MPPPAGSAAALASISASTSAANTSAANAISATPPLPPSSQPPLPAHLDPATYPRTVHIPEQNIHLELMYGPLVPERYLAQVARPQAGANVLFLGTTREDCWGAPEAAEAGERDSEREDVKDGREEGGFEAKSTISTSGDNNNNNDNNNSHNNSKSTKRRARTTALTYTSYAPRALATLTVIATAAVNNPFTLDPEYNHNSDLNSTTNQTNQTTQKNSAPALSGLSIAHRLGRVPVSQASIAVAVAAPHRAAAWRAAELVLEQVKARVEVWKWEGVTEDEDEENGDGDIDADADAEQEKEKEKTEDGVKAEAEQGPGVWKANRDTDANGRRVTSQTG